LWCNGHGVALATDKGHGRVRLAAVLLSGNNFGQVVHTRVPLSPSSIIWYRSMGIDSLGWDGNRRFGVALAIYASQTEVLYPTASKPKAGKTSTRLHISNGYDRHIISKHDVIYKTRNTQRISTPPDDDRAMASVNAH